MARSTKRTRAPSAGGDSPPPAAPELVIVTREDAAMRASAGRFEALSAESTKSLGALLGDYGAEMTPIFGPTEERIIAASRDLIAAESAWQMDMSRFYQVTAVVDKLDAMRDDLIKLDLVDGAYVKPGAEPAAFLNDMAPTPQEAPPATPDFTARQGYLDAAPGGVEARWAWTQAGGRGAGIRIIDIEGAWRFDHEDLMTNQGGLVGGTMSSDIGWRNHGTAVLGEYSGDLNAVGVSGISSDAIASAISIFGGTGSAGAINAAAARLGPGDVILIELHRPGPRNAFAQRDDQRGYIAVEWWPDDFAAILNAVNRGIIVVEAAGNGAENLDDAIYQTPATGFPSGWTNPFRRTNRDSGAILVGAGAPPAGTHGRTHGADRSRLDFSNFGALIDTQGWGREVTTAGYGDLQGGTNENIWYTDRFSGTSSASPIIVGVAASLQGMARARGAPVLTPAQFRNCLRTTGSPQQDEPGRPATQRIGNRPNLRQLATCAFGKGKELRKEVIKEGKEIGKEIKESRKELKDARKEFVKELKERSKDFKDVRKETKEFKEFKERPDKNIKEKDKDIREGGVFDGIRDRVDPFGGGAPVGGDLEQRLEAIEGTLDSLVHFIGAELRPDLAASALGSDAQNLSQTEQEAKYLKDQKDTESY